MFSVSDGIAMHPGAGEYGEEKFGSTVMFPYSPVTVGTSHSNFVVLLFEEAISIFSCLTDWCNFVGIFCFSAAYSSDVISHKDFHKSGSKCATITEALIAVEQISHDSKHPYAFISDCTWGTYLFGIS